MAWMVSLNRFNPPFIRSAAGAVFTDVDGNDYLDFNVADLSMTMGYGPAPVVRAVSRQVLEGAQFLLPTEDALVVCQLLAEQVGLPCWQFTLSASGANIEVMRIARHITGREKIVVFDGHYHGHIDETLVSQGAEGVEHEQLGLPKGSASQTLILPFNDLAALEEVLARRDVALVLTEPALTNCTLVRPTPGYLEGVRRLTAQYGSLLCLDEAHTFQFAHGGLTGSWQLKTDFVVLGKGLGSGIAFALYGMTREIAQHLEHFTDSDIGPPGIATGGTLYASALAVSVARACLEEVLTSDNYQRINHLGARLANGLRRAFATHNLPWLAFQLGPRSGYCLTKELPKNGAEANLSMDAEFIDCRRLFMANRGIWDGILSAGPQVSFVHTESDIDRYVDVATKFLEELFSAK
ncbi:aminotransferase class III-fold pyridoxal phosphate-dependent enzyme [Pseudomonas sp. N40(2020)]|uniref:aminotransferase class III-fold pyridoxal phosphate-dependent enzyme n=1 Tax=Pseudomonas sp. N40(2020) TaxID=2767798 RepID=UPI001656E777|nr:aminotransferase class III-fold pyridoxal phosphate-dependent enzyme [Pseudomonas sp. N40(2020)]